MAADAEFEKSKLEELEAYAREAQAKATSEQAKRESAEQAAREAIANVASERAKREAAEQAAREAASAVSVERAARSTAEKSAEEYKAKAAAERSAREFSEEALIEKVAKLQTGTYSERQSVTAASTGNPSAASAATKSAAASTPAQTTAPTQTTPTAPSASSRSWLIPLAIFGAAGLLFFLISSFWTTWENNVSVKTDDAYVRSDIAPLSTKSTGIVKSTEVNDFQAVKEGQILVELKNDEYKARVEQAKEAIRQAEIKIADMKERKAQQDSRVAQARSAHENSTTTVTQAMHQISSVDASVLEAQAGIEEAKAAILQVQAACKAAEADVTRTKSERTRQESLLALESATKERVELAVNENERALSNLAAQKAAESKAKADLAARQALLVKAMQQLTISRAEKSKTLQLVTSQQAELEAQINQRKLLDGEEKQLISDLAAKKSGLTSANVDLDYTIIRAPADGIVGELKVKPGQLVSAGTQVITIISAKPWVIANYRETQLAKVKEGDRAEVSIDALPGTHLKGRVEKIAPASGAQFSLLPPDNASGNFTKITQRVPVKIAFDDDKQQLANLRPGMSATATISPGSGK